mgnify:CR=1 FL=1
MQNAKCKMQNAGCNALWAMMAVAGERGKKEKPDLTVQLFIDEACFEQEGAFVGTIVCA